MDSTEVCRQHGPAIGFSIEADVPDSVYAFYSRPDHHVTRVRLTRFRGRQKAETQRLPPEHSERRLAREERPLESSIGQPDLTTENPRTSRIHEIIRGLMWSTRPDSNWRPSRWQRVAIVEFIDVYDVYRA